MNRVWLLNGVTWREVTDYQPDIMRHVILVQNLPHFLAQLEEGRPPSATVLAALRFMWRKRALTLSAA